MTVAGLDDQCSTEIWGVFRPLLSPIVTPANLEPPPFRELLEFCSKNGYILETKFTYGEKIEATMLVQLKEKLIVRQSCGKSKKDAKAHAASKLLGDLEKEGLLISKNAGRMQQLQKEIEAGSTSGVSFSGIHVNYKSTLQTYAQKNGKQLPLYSRIQYGPPHAPQFKSIVTIDGKPFESPQYYDTIKEAESAAAYAAIMSLTQEA